MKVKGPGIVLSFVLCVVIWQLVKHDWHEGSTSAATATRVAIINAKRDGGTELAKPDASTRIKILENYGKLPLAFEDNRGQLDQRVKFLSRGAGYTLFLTADEAVLSVPEGKANDKRPRTNRGNKFQQSPAVDRHLSSRESEQQTRSVNLAMKLVGSDPNVTVSGADELPSKTNYFLGSDPKKWQTNLANYAKVKYAGVYPGVDLIYYGNQSKLEYDFVVAPGADPNIIRFSVAADHTSATAHRVAPVRITANGDLMVKMDGGEIRLHKPIAYQTNDSGAKDYIKTQYVLEREQSQISLAVASYDRGRQLIIDPVLTYSTYLGPSGGIYAIAVDASGNAYVTGGNTRTGLPTTPGTFLPTCPGLCTFVSKLNSAGSALVYSTYIGGSYIPPLISPFGYSIAVDSAGDAYVTGAVWTTDFPTTPGAFQTVCKACAAGHGTAFVTKLNPSGSALVYSTFLGGKNGEYGYGIALDASDNAYVTGSTGSSDFPVTPGCFQSTIGTIVGTNAFVTKLNPTGSALVYSTYLGGYNASAAGIALNSAGNAYVMGHEDLSFPTTTGAFRASCTNCIFTTEFSADGSALVYSTVLGGMTGASYPGGIALDTSGNAYVTGVTYASDFPTTPGAFQTTCPAGCGPINGGRGSGIGFLTKFNPSGTAASYSTYLGGTGYSAASGVVVDGAGNAYVGGYTESLNFPVTPDAFQSACDSCTTNNGDAFLAEVNSSGSSLLYATYLGGSQADGANGIALDSNGNIYLAGQAGSTNFPTTAGAFQPTASSSTIGAFVAKFTFGSSATVVTPTNLSFGSILVGSPSGSQPVNLDNSGTGTLPISSVAIGGTNSNDFAQTNDCGTGIVAGTSCTINVTFSPSATGTRNASLIITDNASNSPQSIPLTGSGTDFSIGVANGGPSTSTVAAGNPATYNLQVNPLGGFNGTVNLTCSGAPSSATCAVSPTSATPNGAAGPFTVTVSTTASSTVISLRPDRWHRPKVLPICLLLALMAWVLLTILRNSTSGFRKSFAYTSTFAALILILAYVGGCGGGGNSAPHNSGTPAGTSKLIITGTSSGVTRTQSLTLTVQ
jgi:Beta-propeller repeat/Abnormal spindle-like microcephaly-assoc'd, ASPM-SPD-2-Hydin